MEVREEITPNRDIVGRIMSSFLINLKTDLRLHHYLDYNDLFQFSLKASTLASKAN